MYIDINILKIRKLKSVGGRGGGLIDSQLREVEICRWRGRGGGQSTANSERLKSVGGEEGG